MKFHRFVLVGMVSWLGLAVSFSLFATQSRAQSMSTVSGNVSTKN